MCQGSYASKPYRTEIGNIKIYSIEELCYYISNNLEILIEIDLNKSLIKWIREELQMFELADNILSLHEEKVSNKIIIRTIINSCNYFSNIQRIKINQAIEDLENSPPIQRKIHKGGQLLMAKKFKEGEKNFESMLTNDEANQLTAKEYGQILNNLGIAKLYTVGIKEASVFLRRAYEMYNSEDFLKQYLISLKLSSQDDLFIEEVDKYGLNEEWTKNLDNEINGYIKDYESSNDYQEALRLKELSQSDVSAFLEEAKAINKDFESKYRRCNNGDI